MRRSSIRASPIVGADVVATLERVCKVMGYPSAIRVDQGSEFVSRDLDLWAYQNDVTLDFSRPGKPTRQCVHRGVQRSTASGMLEHALVLVSG